MAQGIIQGDSEYNAALIHAGIKLSVPSWWLQTHNCLFFGMNKSPGKFAELWEE